jgi:probable addiction module antidote protein
MKTRDFNETFAYELRDPEFAAGYLQACLEYETVDAFLIALKEIAQANGGMTKLAEATSLGRESLYKTLSAQGNPEFKTLDAILSALGMRFSVVRCKAAAETSQEVPQEALQAA